MAAATLLCRQAELVGATFDQSSGSVLITVQGDGVRAYNLEKRQLGSLTLGSRSGLEFQVASAHCKGHVKAAGEAQHSRIIASVVHDSSANSHTLCISDLGVATRPISNAPLRVALPGPAQSCHLLHPRYRRDQNRHVASSDASTRRLAAAVVLSDGSIGVTDLDPAGPAGPLHVLPCGQQQAPRYVLATSVLDTLVVATQSAAGMPVTMRAMRLSPASTSAASGLVQVKALTLPCPGGKGPAATAHVTPTGLTMSAHYVLLQWSNGHATAVHHIHGGGGNGAPLQPCTFPLAEAVLANGASSSMATASTPAATASSRKRKNAADSASGVAARSTQPRVLCAAVDARQFVILDLQSAAAQSQVCFSLHDAQFGCLLSSGALEVEAPLLSLDPSQCTVVGAGPEGTIVRLGSTVHVLQIRTQPVSLLSLVAQLSVSAMSLEAAAPGNEVNQGLPDERVKSGRASVIAAAAVKPVVELPAPVSFDLDLMPCQVVPRTGSAENVTADEGDDDVQDDVLQPVPASVVSRIEDICISLVQQLSAAVTASRPSQMLLDTAVSYIAGRRQHSMAVPLQLLGLTARGLVAAKQWSQLGGLLAHVPQGGLSGCSEVLVTVAAAQQYSLLSRLAICLDEVDPNALVGTLQLLLAPTTRSNLAERQKHYEALRAMAEALVAGAEHSGANHLNAAHNADSAMVLAQCGAAAVDGFSYREVLLHPLLAMPMDAPAVQGALRRLSAPAVDVLFGYLAKWVVKYTSGAIGDAAAFVALPQELLFPYYHQVLEWVRMTIDAHLTRLLMAREPLPALESMETALRKTIEGTKRLMMLRGALEHVNAAAPLPEAHMAVATQYTAEVLDLRVR